MSLNVSNSMKCQECLRDGCQGPWKPLFVPKDSLSEDLRMEEGSLDSRKKVFPYTLHVDTHGCSGDERTVNPKVTRPCV